MATSPQSVANYFLQKAANEGMSLDHMKLQKLVYIAHGWHLAMADEPLINCTVEAWKYGPVIPSLYQTFKAFGNKPITEPACYPDPECGEPKEAVLDTASFADPAYTRDLLDYVWNGYKKFSALQLSSLTHETGTPWSHATYNGRVWDLPISDYIIAKHYKELKEKHERTHVQQAAVKA